MLHAVDVLRSGAVTSSPAGLMCTGGFGQTCTGTFPVGTIVTLTASPSATHTFSGWGGACAGQGCTVELAGDRFVVAGFTNPPSLVLRFYHTDAIGSVRAITDEARQVLERFDYGPFGKGVAASRPRLSGKMRDVESALDYFGARYYASRIGQFTTVDPVVNAEAALFNPQRWNRYLYANNNPLAFVDPDGRDAVAAVYRVLQTLRYHATRAVSIPTAIEAVTSPLIDAAFGPNIFSDPGALTGETASLLNQVGALKGMNTMGVAELINPGFDAIAYSKGVTSVTPSSSLSTPANRSWGRLRRRTLTLNR